MSIHNGEWVVEATVQGSGGSRDFTTLHGPFPNDEAARRWAAPIADIKGSLNARYWKSYTLRPVFRVN